MTENKTAVIENVSDFTADQIFDCGQCFRFIREEDGSWTGTAFDRIINVRTEEGGRLIIENSDDEEAEKIWRPYFDLDRDYGAVKKELADNDPVLKDAIICGNGIRILRQDPWETVLSFIISQNNNIPRIRKCIESVADNFGKPLGSLRGRAFSSLPGPEVLAELDEEDLAPCRLGYRAKYIIKTARFVADAGRDRLDALASDEISSQQAFEYISSLNGVGPKVANCILLFGLSKYDRFPIDVWMKKVMSDLYGFDEKDVKGMASFAEKTYGRHCGIAQQYLFYFVREQSLRQSE